MPVSIGNQVLHTDTGVSEPHRGKESVMAIRGTGQHSHEIPQRDGRVVEMRDGGHLGTAIWWSAAHECYYLAPYDSDVAPARAQRLVLLKGQNVEELSGADYGCDLDTPDGLTIVGTSMTDDLAWLSSGAELLWDSAASRITIDPGKMGGVPCIRGLRIPVATVADALASGMAKEVLLDLYPDLEYDDLEAALSYQAAIRQV